MPATLEPLTAPRETWRAVSPTLPPQDREITIVANIVDRDEWSTSVEPYQGRARWSEKAQDWLDEFGMSIRGFYESELVILEWSDVNECREFILKGRGRLIRLAPRRQPIAALPAPAWHTRHPDRGEYELEFRKWITGLTPLELFELRAEHDLFVRAWCGLAGFRDVDGEFTVIEILRGGRMARGLSWEQRYESQSAMDAVERRIDCELLWRYKQELEKRKRAATKAIVTRRVRAIEARAEEATSRRVAL